MAQKFVYTTGGRDVTLDDPDDSYTPQQIKDHWAATFPELSNATWDTKEEAGGVKVVTFAKKVGTKGSDGLPMFDDMIEYLKETRPQYTDAEWIEKIDTEPVYDWIDDISLEEFVDYCLIEAAQMVILAHLLQQPEHRRAIVKMATDGRREDWPILKGEVKVGGFSVVAE